MNMEIVHRVFLAMMRYAAPVLAGLILLRCALQMLRHHRQRLPWAFLEMSDGKRLPVCLWENVLGRGKNCDVRIGHSTVTKYHGVLTRYDDGSWSIATADLQGDIAVNGASTQMQAIEDGDKLLLGGMEVVFRVAENRAQEVSLADAWRSVGNLTLLTVLQFLTCLGYLLHLPQAWQIIAVAFGGLCVAQWGLWVFYACIHRPAFEVETVGFFLCTMAMAVICSTSPGEAVKQLVAVGLGLVFFLTVGWSLRSLERAKRIRYVAAVAGMSLLVATLLFGQVYYGAKNWIVIHGISLQPSEIAKVCFVYVGASPLERLLKKRNLVLFIAYTVALCGLLALMNDFGTAMVFFVAFLMIAYLRSGSIGTVALACTALLFAGVIGLQIAPHALRRFAAWRRIWQDPLGAGYQQTRALMCIASGGLWGLGIGKGKMKRIFAADSDMVFATVCEEWGLWMGILCVVAVVLLAVFAVRCVDGCRSSFYAIGTCTAAGILLTQTILNVLGTVDLLPLTGITFPLLSNGGSSMVGVWGLLAFIKAADHRPGGSFAVRRKDA